LKKKKANQTVVRSGDAKRVSVRRRWVFRLSALVLPLVLLVVVELVLRLFGYGYPTGFFLEDRANDRNVLTNNDQFGWRFFPRAMARTPRPFSIPATKPPDTYRIFILGESAAWGDPEPAVGFARMIEVMLRECYPGTHFEVVNAAMTAINSHAILPIARDCAKQDGDLWLIYMGHNEVVGPFGAGTVFGAEVPALPLIRVNVAMKSLRIGQWLGTVRDHFSAMQTQSWGGMRMFLDKQIATGDPRLEKVYRHFEQNLRDILQTGDRAGVKQIVCTVGRNLKDCPPFASRHGAGFGGERQVAWEKLFSEGATAESAGRFAEATNFYSQAAQLDRAFAELHFRLGRCLSALGSHDDAKRSFEMARDLDTLRFRADSRINRIVQKNAEGRTNDGIYFLDASAALAASGVHGIVGKESFYEHVHLTFEGNYVVARAAAEQIAALLPTRIANAATNRNWLSLDECARRLVWTDWSRHRVLEDIHQRLLDPPFTNQLGWKERNAHLEKQLAELSPARATNALDAAQQYASAVALNPDDWVLREKFGEVLRDLRRHDEVIQQWRQVVRLLPHHASAYNNLGNLFNAIGDIAEAKQNFSEALRRNPDMVEAMNGMGLALANEGMVEQAIGYYSKALRAKSDFVAAHVNLGVALAAQGQTAQAMEQFNAALRLKPDDGSAHGNLAKLLAAQGRQPEALKHFAEAAHLMSNNAAARFNFGNALFAQNQESAAADEYSAAVRLDPNFTDARVNLGTILVRHGQFAQGAAHLREAVRSNSNSAPAHLGLGVALEQQGIPSEAAAHYREVLRIDPANAMAKKRLENIAGR
jgi:tetratricopeptide (TPR) repeat protein